MRGPWRSGVGVGVARYIRSAEDPTLAEIAVAVVDLPETGLDRLKRLLGGVARGELIFSPARPGLMRAQSATKSRG